MSPARIHRPATIILLSVLLLPSCGLVRAPVRIASGVVRGTAHVTEKAVTAPINAHQRRKARKEAEQAKADKDGKKPADDAADPAAIDLPERPETAAPKDFPLPTEPELPPLPAEYSLPPVGHE